MRVLITLLVTALTAAAASITLGWNFEHCVADTLQVSNDLVTWTNFPGPYQLSEDGVEYRVSVPLPTNNARVFFRVSRWFGEPWVTNLPPVTTNNNYHCKKSKKINGKIDARE